MWSKNRLTQIFVRRNLTTLTTFPLQTCPIGRRPAVGSPTGRRSLPRKTKAPAARGIATGGQIVTIKPAGQPAWQRLQRLSVAAQDGKRGNPLIFLMKRLAGRNLERVLRLCWGPMGADPVAVAMFRAGLP